MPYKPDSYMLLKTARRVVVAVIGVTVVLIGLVLVVLPGPAFVVIPAGLAILATEFAWAKWLLKRVRERATDMVNSVYTRSPRPQKPVAREPDGATADPSPTKAEPAHRNTAEIPASQSQN